MRKPTDAQIQQLRDNCYNISLWLDHTHDFMQDIVNEVYFKVTQPTVGDPSQKFTSTILNLALAGIADVDCPGAAISGFALDAVVSSFETDTPDALKKQFGDVWGRFGATFQALEDAFGEFAADPIGSWNKTFTVPDSGETFTVSQLSDPGVLFPSRDPDGDPQFYNPAAFDKMTDVVKVDFKYNLAKYVMGLKWSILHQPNRNFWSGWNDADARNFAKSQIAGNRDVFLTWWPDQDGSCAGCPNNGMSTSEPRIGVGEWYSNWDYYHGDKPSRDLCDWLLQDDGFGTVYNPGAITTRHDVFYNWPLEGNLTDHPDHTPRPSSRSEVSPESRHRAKGWHKLFAETSRAEAEATVVQRAAEDPVFLAALVKNPKAALEEHFGLAIPDEVKIEVIRERPGDYKLVLPYVGRQSR